MNKANLLLIAALSLFPLQGIAYEWVNDTQVEKIGTYQHDLGHFVWLTTGSVKECQQAIPENSTLKFDEGSIGGKALLTVLVTALLTKATVDVQVVGCDIVEVYLK